MKRKNLCCSLALLALTGCSTELDRCIDANIERITAEYQITERLYEKLKVLDIGVSEMPIPDPSWGDKIVWARNLDFQDTEVEVILYLLDDFSIDHSPRISHPFNGLHVSRGNSVEILGKSYPTLTVELDFLDRELLEEIQEAINTYLPAKGAERFCNSQGIY
jgi:hypothetical protein